MATVLCLKLSKQQFLVRNNKEFDAITKEIESVKFNYADIDQMMEIYDPKKLQNGFNNVNGEEIFYIPNPGLGLWSWKDKFNQN